MYQKYLRIRFRDSKCECDIICPRYLSSNTWISTFYIFSDNSTFIFSNPPASLHQNSVMSKLSTCCAKNDFFFLLALYIKLYNNEICCGWQFFHLPINLMHVTCYFSIFLLLLFCWFSHKFEYKTNVRLQLNGTITEILMHWKIACFKKKLIMCVVFHKHHRLGRDSVSIWWN